MADRTNYGRACAARARVETAVALLRSARAEVSAIIGVGEQHDVTKAAGKALLDAQVLLAKLELLVPRIP